MDISSPQTLPGFARDHQLVLELESLTLAEIDAHVALCDGSDGPALYPGMLDEPCIICSGGRWELWDADPYGQLEPRCGRCGGLEATAELRARQVAEVRALDGGAWPLCRSCGGPLQLRAPAPPWALAAEWCIAVMHGELRL